MDVINDKLDMINVNLAVINDKLDIINDNLAVIDDNLHMTINRLGALPSWQSFWAAQPTATPTT